LSNNKESCDIKKEHQQGQYAVTWRRFSSILSSRFFCGHASARAVLNLKTMRPAGHRLTMPSFNPTTLSQHFGTLQIGENGRRQIFTLL
jgi:hypothetical protein